MNICCSLKKMQNIKDKIKNQRQDEGVGEEGTG